MPSANNGKHKLFAITSHVMHDTNSVSACNTHAWFCAPFSPANAADKQYKGAINVCPAE